MKTITCFFKSMASSFMTGLLPLIVRGTPMMAGPLIYSPRVWLPFWRMGFGRRRRPTRIWEHLTAGLVTTSAQLHRLDGGPMRRIESIDPGQAGRHACGLSQMAGHAQGRDPAGH